MKHCISTLFLFLSVMMAQSQIRLEYGPFNIVVPEDWSLTKEVDSKRVLASSAYALDESDGGLPMNFRFEEKAKIGETLEELVDFIQSKVVDDPENAKSLVTKKLAQEGIESAPTFKVSAPKIVAFGEAKAVTATSRIVFPQGDLKIPVLVSSFWVYGDETAYLLRIVVPEKLRERSEDDYRELLDSLRIRKQG